MQNNKIQKIKDSFLRQIQEKMNTIQKNKEKLEELMSQTFEDNDIDLSENFEEEELENNPETT